jgi:serine O-acetyltransferase
MLITDLSRIYRHVGGGRTRRIYRCYLQPGYRAVKIYRFGHWVLNQRTLVRRLFWPVYSFFQYRMKRKWGIEIYPGAEIGNGLLIFHYGGIFIGPVVMGKNATITQDVTIGMAGFGTNRGAPTIGDNILISPGAKLAGKIKIGNNVRIGSNVVVQHDIPDNALVQVRRSQIVIFASYSGAAPVQVQETGD